MTTTHVEPTTETDRAIEFDAVGKKFDDTWVLEDLDFYVAPSTIMGLIGPSGCGKTTTVRLATGYHRPDAGNVEILGSSPSDLDGSRRADIGYLPQHPVLFDDMSLRDNLNFHASLNGVRFRRKHRLQELLELVDLDGDERKLVSESSGGMQRRLALAGALVHDPSILMLDEPTAGIDPILRRRFWEHFRTLRDAGQTLVISTQFVSEASNCDVVAMLAHGRIAAIGAPLELLKRARGGRLVDVEFDQELRYEFVQRLREQPSVVSVVRDKERNIEMTIDPEGPSASEIIENVEPGIHPTSVSERAPDWDEVFIALVGDDASDDVDDSSDDASDDVDDPPSDSDDSDATESGAS